MLAFMLGFMAVLMMVSYLYLLPALDAAVGAQTPQERGGLAAYSALLLVVVLVVLLGGLMLSFRIGRMFLPRPRPTRTQTQYVDAWAEAGRRATVPPPEDDQEPE